MRNRLTACCRGLRGRIRRSANAVYWNLDQLGWWSASMAPRINRSPARVRPTKFLFHYLQTDRMRAAHYIDRMGLKRFDTRRTCEIVNPPLKYRSHPLRLFLRTQRLKTSRLVVGTTGNRVPESLVLLQKTFKIAGKHPTTSIRLSSRFHST